MLGYEFDMIKALRAYRTRYDCSLGEALKYLEKDLKTSLERVQERIKSMEETKKKRHNL